MKHRPFEFEVGDPRRRRIGLGIVSALVLATAFTLFTFVAKETLILETHSPWANDPYDAIVSFTIFLVPILALLMVGRVALCLKTERLPFARTWDLIRGARIIVGAVGVTLASQWISVVLQTNRSSWSSFTAILIGGLAVLSVATGVVALLVRRASSLMSEGRGDSQHAPDWIAEGLLTLDKKIISHLGRLAPAVRAGIHALDVRIADRVRRQPIVAAAVGALAFGIAMSMSTAVGEHFVPTLKIARVFVLFTVVGASSMYVFFIVGGRYIGLVHQTAVPLGSVRRCVLDATIVGAAAIWLSAAFRSVLFPLVGGAQQYRGSGSLIDLVLVVGSGAFIVTLAIDLLKAAYQKSSAA